MDGEIQFQSDAQRECYHKIKPWMKEIFGAFTIERKDYPLLGGRIGSAFVQTGVHPWGDDDSTVTTRSYVVTGAELTPELMHYLLLKNHEMRFGAFAVDPDGDILFEHSIVGSTCDQRELHTSVMAVLSVADQHDDEIVSRWGGQRAIDHQ
jgi:hypothetical protein